MKKSWTYNAFWAIFIAITCFGAFCALERQFRVTSMPYSVLIYGELGLLGLVALGIMSPLISPPFGLWILRNGERYVLKNYQKDRVGTRDLMYIADPNNPDHFEIIKRNRKNINSIIGKVVMGGIYEKKGGKLILVSVAHTKPDEEVNVFDCS